MQVVSLDKRVDASVVEQLEYWLELARSGDIANIIVVGASDNGDVYRGWANGNYPFRIIGELEVAKYLFMRNVIDGC